MGIKIERNGQFLRINDDLINIHHIRRVYLNSYTDLYGWTDDSMDSLDEDSEKKVYELFFVFKDDTDMQFDLPEPENEEKSLEYFNKIFECLQ